MNDLDLDLDPVLADRLRATFTAVADQTPVDGPIPIVSLDGDAARVRPRRVPWRAAAAAAAAAAAVAVAGLGGGGSVPVTAAGSAAVERTMASALQEQPAPPVPAEDPKTVSVYPEADGLRAVVATPSFPEWVVVDIEPATAALTDGSASEIAGDGATEQQVGEGRLLLVDGPEERSAWLITPTHVVHAHTGPVPADRWPSMESLVETVRAIAVDVPDLSRG